MRGAVWFKQLSSIQDGIESAVLFQDSISGPNAGPQDSFLLPVCAGFADLTAARQEAEEQNTL